MCVYEIKIQTIPFTILSFIFLFPFPAFSYCKEYQAPTNGKSNTFFFLSPCHSTYTFFLFFGGADILISFLPGVLAVSNTTSVHMLVSPKSISLTVILYELRDVGIMQISALADLLTGCHISLPISSNHS